MYIHVLCILLYTRNTAHKFIYSHIQWNNELFKATSTKINNNSIEWWYMRICGNIIIFGKRQTNAQRIQCKCSIRWLVGVLLWWWWWWIAKKKVMEKKSVTVHTPHCHIFMYHLDKKSRMNCVMCDINVRNYCLLSFPCLSSLMI